MTTPATTPAITPATTRRRSLGTVAAALGAAGAATAITLTTVLGSPVASADPGDTRLPIGSSQLVQSEDLTAIDAPFDTESVRLGRDGDFSACLGEGNPWTSVLRGSPKPIKGVWTRRGHREQALYEDIAQADSVSQAKKFAATLVNRGIRACRQPTTYDFHYGPLQTGAVGSGVATWALAYRGDDAEPDGGVVVIRKGSNVGFVQVGGLWDDPEQTMESVAKVATSRLAESS